MNIGQASGSGGWGKDDEGIGEADDLGGKMVKLEEDEWGLE